MKQTETYKLKLIETSDTFSPDALNRNAEALEGELARLDAALDAAQTGAAKAQSAADAAQTAAAKAQTTADAAQTAAAKAQSTADGKLGQTATAAAAKKLETPQTIQVNLGATTAASFDGTASVTPGVTGTLPVARGGTNKTSWTANRLIYPSATTTLAQLAFPTVSGSVLRQGTSGAPYWTSPADLTTALGAARCVAYPHTGTGQSTITHTFAFSPQLVMIWSSMYPYNMIAVARGQESASRVNNSAGSEQFKITWTNTGVTFAATSSSTNAPEFICNGNNLKYFLVAIG